MTPDPSMSRRAFIRLRPGRDPDDQVAQIQTDACLAHRSTLCTVCSERCPEPGAIRVEHGKPSVSLEACTGCGTCRDVCPAPYNAVIIVPRDRVVPARCQDPPAQPDVFDWRAAYLNRPR